MKTNDWKDEEIAIPDGLKTRLEHLIDDLAEQEILQTRRRRLWLRTFSAAASIAFLLLITVFFPPKKTSNLQLTAQIENPELAYIEAQKALEKVSIHFNKGMDQLAFVSEKMEKTNQILEKTLKK